MRQVPKLHIFAIIISAELGNNLLAPLLAFIFLAANTPLFTHSVTLAERSILFGAGLSLYKLGEVFANIVITTLSDHFGRKMAVYSTLCGLLILSIAGFGALMWHQPLLLLGGLFLASALNTNKAVGPTMMADISLPQQRVINMATIQSVIAMGACLGPIIGGHLAKPFLQTTYDLPFVFIAVLAIVGLTLTRHCPETLLIDSKRRGAKISFRKILGDYWQLLQSPPIRRLFYLLILCQVSWSSYYEFIPPTLKNIFHFSPSQVGLFVGLIAFWLILAASLIIRLLLRLFHSQQLFWLAGITLAIGTLMAVTAGENPTQWWSQSILWISAVPTAMGDVIFFSLFTAFLSQYVGQAQQGKAMGLTLIVANLVWSATALIGGGLLTLHPNGALWFAPCGAIGLLFALPRLSRSAQAHQVEEVL